MADSSKESGKSLVHKLRVLRDLIAADNERDELQTRSEASSSKPEQQQTSRRYNLRSRSIDEQAGSFSSITSQQGQGAGGTLGSRYQRQENTAGTPSSQQPGQDSSSGGSGYEGGTASDQGSKLSSWILVDQPGAWKPSIAIGDSLGENLSKIELADRKVEQWRSIADYHREHLPGALAKVQESLDTAIRERNKLHNTPENRTPRNELASTSKSLIDVRLAGLRTVLADSIFPPEKANIQAAISGYESGAIGASTSYTLIWAGRIVDRCPTYTSFTQDRTERLDGYARQHGPGWLWWEPPLVGERAGGFLKKGICLPNPETTSDPLHPGHFRIRMGYRRIRQLTSRDNNDNDNDNDNNNKNEADRRRHQRRHRHHHPRAPPAHLRSLTRPYTPDPTAPHLFFTVLLDSGASFPVLFNTDLSSCGIDLVSYAASSALNISGIDSTSTKRAYEMEACVYPDTLPSNSTAAGLLPPSHHHHHSSPFYSTPPPPPPPPPPPGSMSCITPVVCLDAGGRGLGLGEGGGGGAGAGGGGFSFHRLSGMVPWLVCYTSSAPGMGCMWVGAQRGDVLGAHRLPGEVLRPDGGRERMETTTTAMAMGPPPLRQLNPAVAAGLVTPTAVRFEHALGGGGSLVDEDCAGPGARSVVRVTDGSGREESRWVDVATGREGRGPAAADARYPDKEKEKEKETEKEKEKKEKKEKEEREEPVHWAGRNLRPGPRVRRDPTYSYNEGSLGYGSSCEEEREEEDDDDDDDDDDDYDDEGRRRRRRKRVRIHLHDDDSEYGIS